MNVNNYDPQEPLEDIPKDERLDALTYRADLLISNSDFFQDGVYYTPTPDSDQTRQGRAAYCRKIWHNTDKSINFDYLYGKVAKPYLDETTGLTHVIEMVQPAEVRHIPIVRPKLQSLISRILERPLRPRPYTVSEESIQAKMDAHINQLRTLEMEKFMLRYKGVMFMQKGIELQQQLMQQIGQAQQQAQQAGQPEDPKMGEYLQQVQLAIEQAKMMMEASTNLTDEEREKVSNYYQYSHKDTVEQAIDGLLAAYIERYNLEQISKDIFTEKMVTDEPIIKVWWEEGMQEPSFEMLHSEQVSYPICESKSKLRDLDYCVIHRTLMYHQAVEKHGNRLTKDDLVLLRKDATSGGDRRQHLPILPDGRVIGHQLYEQYDQSQIDEYEVFMKERESIKAIERMDENDEKWYEPVKEGYKPKKGEKMVTRYRTVLYHLVRLGRRGSIYPIAQKSAWQPRPFDNPSRVYLPVVGEANSRYHQAHSLVWETRDIQELFNILHYQEETAIVLAGLRGIVYDMSQKPEGMELAEVIYYMKRGLMVIESVKPNGQKTSFNQFQGFDQSISPSIGMIGQIKSSLIDLVSMITGVTPQQQGQIVKTDQVGTYEAGLAMSTAAVEIYFQEHEWMMEQAFELLANAMLPCYAKGTRKLSVNGIRQQIVSLPPDVRDKIMVKIQSSRRSQKSMERVQAAIGEAHAKGMINLSQFIQISDVNNLSEMTTMLKDFEDKARSIVEGQGQQQQQMAQQMQQQALQMQAQIDQQLEQFKGQQKERLVQIQAQIDMQKAQMSAGMEQAGIAKDIEVAQMNDATKRYGINVEQSIEAEYLLLEKQKLNNDHESKRLDRTLNFLEARIKQSSVQKSAGGGNPHRKP